MHPVNVPGSLGSCGVVVGTNVGHAVAVAGTAALGSMILGVKSPSGQLKQM